MEQLGDVAAVTITVIDEAFCWLCCAYAIGLHTVEGTWIQPAQISRRLWISQRRWLSAFLESKHGAFSVFRKALCWGPMINAAIMRRGFIHISLIGITNGPIKRTTTGTSAYKSEISVRFWATIRFHRERATTCAPWFLWLHLLIITKWFDELRCLVPTATIEANFGSIHSCFSHVSCSVAITAIALSFFRKK